MDRKDHIKSTLRDFNIGYNRQQRRGVDGTVSKKKKVDAPKNKDDLIQAWHMQRVLLQKQGLEIERYKQSEIDWTVTEARKDKEIELYKRTVEHDTKEIKLLTAEIDSKDEEIEQLGEAIKQNKITWQLQRDVMEGQLKEIERLKKALEKYGIHKKECGVYEGRIKCVCGFEQALKGI